MSNDDGQDWDDDTDEYATYYLQSETTDVPMQPDEPEDEDLKQRVEDLMAYIHEATDYEEKTQEFLEDNDEGFDAAVLAFKTHTSLLVKGREPIRIKLNQCGLVRMSQLVDGKGDYEDGTGTDLADYIEGAAPVAPKKGEMN